MTEESAPPPKHPVWAGRLFIALGLAVFGVELGRYWVLDHPIHPWPICIGAALGFVGFYLEYPAGAKDAGGFLVNSTVTILGVLPFAGRRKTDAIAAAALTKQEAPTTAIPTAMIGAGGDTVILVPGVTSEPHVATDDEAGVADAGGDAGEAA